MADDVESDPPPGAVTARDEAARAMWGAGDYATIGDWFADASRSVLDGLDLDGRTVLDVATGTGTVAIEAARRGADVTGVDLTPRLLDVARRRATDAGLDVRFVEGSFNDLGHHRTYDVVTSSFGVMLATEPPAVAKELAAAARSGGVIAVAAWASGGAFGAPPRSIIELIGEEPPVDVTRWAEPGQLTSFFSGSGADVTGTRKRFIGIEFSSVEDLVASLAASCGPWMALLGRLEASGHGGVARELLAQHFDAFAEPSGNGITLRVGYAVTHITVS